MDKNYYEILGLKRQACSQDIANSYKKMVLRWHPKFAKEDQNTAQHHFSEISQAYEVLSDPLKRAFFDKYGWKKLQDGLFQQGQLKGGYRFANNPDEIFEKYFLQNNVFASSSDQKLKEKGNLFSHAFGALNYKQQDSNSDLIVQIPCTLAQLYYGVAKQVSYQRTVVNDDGRTFSVQKQTKLLEIKPGYGKETLLRFKGQGNQCLTRIKSDLVFKIVEIEQQLYSKCGNDLIFVATISLECAIACQPLEITTLDNRRLLISIDQIPNPTTLKQIINQGMPIPNIPGPQRKGNLYIKFNIQFPKKIDEQTRKQLKQLLQ